MPSINRQADAKITNLPNATVNTAEISSTRKSSLLLEKRGVGGRRSSDNYETSMGASSVTSSAAGVSSSGSGTTGTPGGNSKFDSVKSVFKVK